MLCWQHAVVLHVQVLGGGVVTGGPRRNKLELLSAIRVRQLEAARSRKPPHLASLFIHRAKWIEYQHTQSAQLPQDSMPSD